MASLNLFDGEFDKKTAAPCAGKSATAERDEEDLIVVGYACKLFRDDEKAVEAESMLIPWNGEQSGMQSGKISRSVWVFCYLFFLIVCLSVCPSFFVFLSLAYSLVQGRSSLLISLPIRSALQFVMASSVQTGYGMTNHAI